ncbi:hypothetical protein XELAEV_18031598mg [Xenopus laevis]|uniref:G-protein coupled receptors family 1 profile domain-containing protein n=1 Tax=Xenopus laevis TaxID=8355 RepID=A0A974HFX5_XENLA|nr:hypothetical protein XELAEV_18031598mg [Xenopus laevis]
MNLAVADLMLLTVTAVLMMANINTLVGSNLDFEGNAEFITILEIIYDLSLFSGMYLLNVLSVERSISVCFPLRYRSRRPKTLSVVMCVCLWILGCTESVIENLACPSKDFRIRTPVCRGLKTITFTLSICICLPLMIISTFTLIITIRKTFRDRYPPRLYIIIIAAIFIYILSVIPFNFIWFLMYFKLLPSIQHTLKIYFAGILSTSFNPYIYFIVGRLWKQKFNHSIHDPLHSAFKVEEDEKEDRKYFT